MAMFMIAVNDIKNALKKVIDPEIGIDVVSMGLIKEVKISGGNVKIKMTTTSPFCPLADYLVNEVRTGAKAVKGVKEVEVQLIMPENFNPTCER
ncbi:metal-sulfur cluster assembly factor [Candidatus Micrarchaeota archaeon]|nr:metal-sulfur cluster assembly factor [Candidatus Micrarchaeota archaeon]